MKIAYLFSRYPVPSQTFCDTEIRALEAAGHEIEIYSCSAPTSSFRHGGPADWPRARVHYAPPAAVLDAWEAAARRDGTWPAAMVADHLARFGPRYDPARRARHALYFSECMHRQGVEHVHVHFANRATHAALFIHTLTGVPFSFTAHAQDFLVDLGSDDLLRLMCERAAFVVAVSEWSRRALIERCPAAEGKIRRVYNGLELDLWPPRSTKRATADDRLKIFGVGRLIEFKGFQDLIAACRLLRDRGVPFSCEIAGEGPLRAALEGQAAGLEEIRFAGLLAQEEVRRRMDACDVFALPSLVDAKGASDVLPTVILEAMAASKPVVSTWLAGIPEMVEDGVSGLLVPPGQPEALAGALENLAAKEQERRQLGEAGRLRVVEKFSAAASAEQLGALFAASRANSSSVSGKRTGSTADGRIVCLCDEFPPPVAVEPEQMRLLAFRAGSLTSHPVPDATLLRACVFLPDDMVFETYWRNNDPAVHQLESWRADAGGACLTDVFLLACRRALYLRRTVFAAPAARIHLHAMGPQALLCAWLLRRLGVAASASFLLPSVGRGRIAGSVVKKLAPLFVGGWVVNERKLALSLGLAFAADKPDSALWTERVKNWAAQAPGQSSA